MQQHVKGVTPPPHFSFTLSLLAIQVNTSFRDFWFSAFHSNDRVNTSTPFARRLGYTPCPLCFKHRRRFAARTRCPIHLVLHGMRVFNALCAGPAPRQPLGRHGRRHRLPRLQDAALPFSMMLFLAGSMTHADSATVQLGYSNASYHWPAFARDTFTRGFTLKVARRRRRALLASVESLQKKQQQQEMIPDIYGAAWSP